MFKQDKDHISNLQLVVSFLGPICPITVITSMHLMWHWYIALTSFNS